MPVVGRSLVDPGYRTPYQTATAGTSAARSGAPTVLGSTPGTTALPSEVLAFIQRYAQSTPIPTGTPGSEHEQRVRDWTTGLVTALAKERPGEGWGLKRAGKDRPLSKDTLAREVDGQVYGWDLLIGTGTGTPKLSDNPQWHDLAGQFFEMPGGGGRTVGLHAGSSVLGGATGGLSSVISGPGSRDRGGRPIEGYATVRGDELGRNAGDAYELAMNAANRQRRKTAQAPGRQSTILGGFAKAGRPSTRPATALGY